MTIDKKLIRSRFNSASDSYDEYALVQKKSAEILAKRLRRFSLTLKPKTVLDVGCGTGYASEALRKYYPKAFYVLTDIALDMLKEAKEKLGADEALGLYVADMEWCAATNHDMIISNLALQWADNLEGIIAALYKKSKIFAFSCLLDGTFREWEQLLHACDLPSTIKKYPKQFELENFLISLGGTRHSFHTADLQIKCQNAYDFMHYLKKIGASASAVTISPKNLARLIKTGSQKFVVTYKIFFGFTERI